MNKLFIISLLLLFATATIVTAVQPTQQYYKAYIAPFYRDSMVLNTNYTYNLTVNPPDGISSVTTAIINFNGQINGQTQTFTLWVNGQSCNNPTYSVATAFSTTGNVQFAFDCSNRITKPGTYNITLRSAVNTGAMQGWLDLTYMNNPLGTTDIFGTEYVEGDDATVFLLLKDSSGVPIENATCTLDIYYPNTANLIHPEWINNGLMMYKEEGLYFYDFTVPLLEGLYMVNAQCTYISDNNYFYTLSKGVGPTRNVTTGTYTGDTFVLNDYSEWLYTQCDSGTVGGGGKACDSWNQWNISSPKLGNVTQLFVQYLGENTLTASMTMYWWNWTNSSWVALPNTLTFKATAAASVPSGVDEYLSNSIPLAAIGTGANSGLVRIRSLTTAGSIFKQFNNWLQLRTSSYTTTIQDLKGSGEVHVSSAPAGVNRYFKVLSCDGFIDGRCGEFVDDGTYDLLEGEIVEYVNISATSTKPSVEINYYSPFSVDCTALYTIEEYINGSWTDYTGYTVYSQPAEENCIVTIDHDIVSGTIYQFRLTFDNFMKWEVDWTKRIADTTNKSVSQICDTRNFTYINPITDTTPISNDSITDFCHQFYDDIYWLNSYYTDSQSVFFAGEYASYLQEMRFYSRLILQKYLFLAAGNNTGLTSDYYASKVWNHPVRNLTYYPPVSVNNTAVADAVWNATSRNLTYYNMTDTTNYTRIDNTILAINTSINANIDNTRVNLSTRINQLEATMIAYFNNVSLNVWTYATRTLTAFGFDNTNYTRITTEVWNATNRNLTYYNMTDTTNYSRISNLTALDVWTYTTRNLTYYQNFSTPQVDMTNYSRISNLTALDVWNYINRNLTYYPAQIDMTNYSRISNLTALDVWTYITRNLTYYAPASVDNNAIATAVWNATTRNLTYYPAQTDMTDYNLIGLYVWNTTTRNLTYYPAQQDLTNYSRISNLTASDVWTYANRNLTYYQNFSTPQQDLTNYTLINDGVSAAVWVYATRNLTYYPPAFVNTTEVAIAVWNSTTRDLTYYPAQIDLTNYSLINQGVWTYIDRNLTYYPAQVDLTNYSAIESGVWAYSNRSLTYYPTPTDLTNYTLINQGVWTYIDRNLTYYPTQVDMTNYSKISNLTANDVWTYATRDLTYYQINNISASDVWNYINRTLTYYETNNISATDVWTYNNRTLTYYPTQADMTNYTAIWTYPDRNLTYYPPAVVNTTAVAEDVWNYTSGRYVDGVLV